MPEISIFYGIKIKMFYDDHNPPHCHAEYAEYNALIDITNRTVIKGGLPGKQLRYALEWCELHKAELMQNWELAKSGKQPNPIEPLA